MIHPTEIDAKVVLNFRKLVIFYNKIFDDIKFLIFLSSSKQKRMQICLYDSKKKELQKGGLS
jgi:hypothetical protein